MSEKEYEYLPLKNQSGDGKKKSKLSVGYTTIEEEQESDFTSIMESVEYSQSERPSEHKSHNQSIRTYSKRNAQKTKKNNNVKSQQAQSEKSISFHLSDGLAEMSAVFHGLPEP